MRLTARARCRVLVICLASSAVFAASGAFAAVEHDG
jgi:hypothetical protein